MNNEEPTSPPHERTDVMEFYRERIMYTLAIAILVFVTPFAVLNIIQGNFLLALGFTTVIATFFIDGLAIHLKKKPPIPFAYLVVPGIFTIVMSLVNEGIPGAWGCFPAVPLCFFVLPRRVAVAASILMIVAGGIALNQQLGLDMALRFSAALTLNVVVIYFITAVIRGLQNDLIDQAITDPLTGAFNRRQMEFALDEAMARHQRTGAPVSVLMIDIDHFKRINDDLGHEAGDSVLKGLVTLIKTRTRRLDRLFRMGGEEFLLLLPDTPGASAMKQAESLRLRIAEAQLLKQRPVTVSIGVAEYQKDLTQNAWVKISDDALYRAKSEGRNRVIFGDAAAIAPDPADGDGRRGRAR
ncbi:MAG: GGDEF domain-containing protein [Rhodospirillaceae bacterium]|nr:GGDEF domain-containing protein [Rhodospirillaceae bacterium]